MITNRACSGMMHQQEILPIYDHMEELLVVYSCLDYWSPGYPYCANTNGIEITVLRLLYHIFQWLKYIGLLLHDQ